MKRILFFSFALVIILNVVCLAEARAQHDGKENNSLAARKISSRIFSAVNSKDQINSGELQQFQDHLQVFQSLLEQKISAADAETRSRYAGIFQAMEKNRQGSSAALSPGNDLYRALETIVTQIESIPVLAMVHEEALRHADKVASATIRPNRGYGATYRSNETVQFAITALEDSFIQLFFLSTPRDGNATPVLQSLVFSPAPGKRSVYLSTGDTLILGEDGSFVVEPPYGSDLIIVVASGSELKPKETADQFHVSYPIDFASLFAEIFGADSVEQLSFHSCFIESRPANNMQATRGHSFALLTEEEAAALRLNEKEWNEPPPAYRSIQAGPIIKVELPTLKGEENPTIETEAPLDLKITFEEKDAPVDMESLEVVAKKGFFTKSITDRVRDYISGTVLQANQLDFPKGKFRIQVQIADINGVKTSREYRLEVE